MTGTRQPRAPGEGDSAVQDAQRVRIVVTGSAGHESGLLRALSRLGRDAEIDVVPDAEACQARCRELPVDLVVVPREPRAECERVLEDQRRDGPPVIVVVGEGEDALALEAFRLGAADCVAEGGDFEHMLPVAALEQIRRERAARERGAVERRIRNLERYHENIIQNLNSALLVVDTRGRITASNPPGEEILGESAETLRGRPVWNWFEASPRGQGLLDRTLSRGERFKGAESTVRRADGSVVPIGISCSPLHDADGTKLGAVAVFQDLTEIQQLQSQVHQTEKMASIGQLAAGVAHEINNPMGFIHANLFQMAEYVADLRRLWEPVEALREAAERGDPEETRRAAEHLASASREADIEFLLGDLAKAIRESQEGSERIRHIVQDLREFSHHDPAERIMADVNQCLDSTANIVWPMMKHLVVLERDYADLPSILCYPMQLKQVFMNLLVNAFQAIEERAHEAGEPGCIRLATCVGEDGVSVTVSDNGVGIAGDHVDRIFEPFFTTKRVGSGTGLGLSTSYSIVRRHGGALTVESKPGEGSVFELFLPLAGPGADDHVD